MKRTTILVSVLALAACSLCLVGCGADASAAVGSEAASSAESTATQSTEAETMNDTVFYATVLDMKSDFGGILVKPESDALPHELVIHAAELPTLSVGDRVRVEHSGQITLSLPGQVYGATVTVVQ